MKHLEIKEAQKQVDDWILQFEVGYWSPLSQLAALVEEVGETAREINHLESSKKKRSGKVNIESELGDVLFALICLANSYGISLEDALKKTISKYDKRDKTRWKLKTKKP